MTDEKSSLSQSLYCILLALTFIEGCIALALTFAVPSDKDSAILAGYSAQRILLGILIAGLSSLFLFLLVRNYRKEETADQVYASLCEYLRLEKNVWCAFLTATVLCFASLWCFQFSWLLIPKNLRPVFAWASIFFLQTALILWFRHKEFLWANIRASFSSLPSLKTLTAKQRRVLLLLLVLGLIYIIVLLPSNINGSESWDAFRHYGGDEYVIYPILRNVMTPGDDFSATLYHHYIYEDYHYGYPFYAWSSFVLLPLRAAAGADFLERIELTLPALRVLVSVVPLILACLILVFIFTRFNSYLLSPAVMLFLITAPGSLQNNQGFWHPDGLNLFFVCCVLYFLQRDSFRYGSNFYLAAFFAGMSAATRLYGFFFFLAIGVYLLMGLLQHRFSLRGLVQKGQLFILLMFVTILWADPFLLKADARANMLTIMAEKSGEMSSGYNSDSSDPDNDYRPGWQAWYPAFEDHFTEMYCFFFLIISMLFASFYGGNELAHKLTFLWFVVIGVYLIFFVAVKSTQYVLPMLLPLMGCIFSLPLALENAGSLSKKRAAWILSCGIFISQLLINLIKIAPRFS